MNKQDILGKADVKIEQVRVAPWDADLFVRSLSGEERDALEASTLTGVLGPEGQALTDMKNFRSKLLVLAICDEQGNRIFASEDTEALGKKNGEALDILFKVAARLSGITREAVKEAEKN